MNDFLRKRELPLDRLDFAANVLLMEGKGCRVMFDAGLGQIANPPSWGIAAGQLSLNMVKAEIDEPDEILLTHGHGEHIGGLLSSDDSPRFVGTRVQLHREESDYWRSPKRTGLNWTFDCTLAQRVFAALGPDLRTFSWNDDLGIDGVVAVPAPGHTIAHTAYEISTSFGPVLNIGDAARHHILNTEQPHWQFVGDFDRALCVATRLQLFERAIETGALVFSYHWPFPGLGRVERASGGVGYRYVPVSQKT